LEIFFNCIVLGLSKRIENPTGGKPEFCPHAGDGEAYVVLNAIDDVASGVPWPSRQREATIDQFSYIL